MEDQEQEPSLTAAPALFDTPKIVAASICGGLPHCGGGKDLGDRMRGVSVPEKAVDAMLWGMHRMEEKMKIERMICALALIGLLTNVSGCLSLPRVREPLPEDTLEEFEDAFNAMDVDGMLECMDEKSVKSMTAGMDLVIGVASAVSGVDINISAEDLIAMLPLFQGMLGDYAAKSEFPEMDLQALETYIKGDRATVYFTETGSGDLAVINMVKEDGKWRLTLSTRAVSPEEADRVIIAGQEEETKSRAEERAEKRAERRAEREAERESKRAAREEASNNRERGGGIGEVLDRLLGD